MPSPYPPMAQQHWGPPWARRQRDRRPARVGFLVVFVAVFQVAGTQFAARHDSGVLRPLDTAGYALLLAGPLALTLRRRYRLATLIVVAACTVTYYTLGYPYGPGFLALLVAVAGAIRAGRRRPALIVIAAGYALFVGVGLVVHRVGGIPVGRPGWGAAVAVAAWTLLALAVAEALRNRTAALAEIGRTRAEQVRARAEQQRRQNADERLRMARELHDVVGHHLSLINVQAGVGLHLMDERPEQARTSLLAIKQASAEALREVRAVLGVLRQDNEGAPRTPTPSLAHLDSLAGDAGAVLVVQGTAVPLAAELDRAAYRIVQEALTNVRRHAGADAQATVTIRYAPDLLTIDVRDDGAGPPVEADLDGGNGIAGMRARALALGGTLQVDAPPSGGLRVSARLPLTVDREDT